MCMYYVEWDLNENMSILKKILSGGNDSEIQRTREMVLKEQN